MKLYLVLLFFCGIWVDGFTEASNGVSANKPSGTTENSPKSTVVYHNTPDIGNGTSYEAHLQTQESRPRGRRQSYSYGGTQRPVSYHESYNSPPYYYESNNPPQSYSRSYQSPPSSYHVDYNERPRSHSHHQSYQSPPQRYQHRSSYNNQDSNEHRDGDDRSYGSDDNDDHHGGGYGGDNDSNNDYHGDDDYGHSPSNNYGGGGDVQDDYGRVNLEY